ncbi:MAG: DHH family phosphoesterase [Candidatus Nanoarchaeia archaeon]|nr:DHH family phosphoesterase [Candidatus Nanoarchaeia archaeon]
MMDKYNEFYELTNSLVAKFKSLNKTPVRIVSHLDADGIAAASILAKALTRENIKFSLSIIKQISKQRLKEFSNENYKIYFFTDLGSNNLSEIENSFNNKEVFILDHHIPEKKETKLNFLNPHLFDIDGTKEISGAGVVYLFTKYLNEINKDLAYLAIVGAIGDIQEDYINDEKQFIGLNKEILKDAQESGKIRIDMGLRMFGIQTRPLHKLLEYSTDPYIPGITGSEENAIQFLNQLNIPVRDYENKWRRLCDLREEELKKLVTGIVLRRMGSEDKPEDILGEIYTIPNEDELSPTRNAREFATLLNACGKLGKSSLGIGVCLGDKKLKIKANELLLDYKKEIIKALNWFYANRKTGSIIEDKNFVIVNVENNLRDTLTGVLTSIISKSNLYKDNTIIMTMVYTPDDEVKVSVRGVNSSIDMKKLLEKIGEKVPLQLGGHTAAAGCLFTLDKEKAFIEAAKEVLSSIK